MHARLGLLAGLPGLAAAERHCSVGTMLPEVCCSPARQHSANPAQGQMAVQAVDLLF